MAAALGRVPPAFNALDQNSDGVIDREEWRRPPGSRVGLGVEEA